MTFPEAVRSTPEIATALKPGLAAVEHKYRNRLQPQNTRFVTGSVDLDGTLQAALPDANRWDYAIGYRPNGETHKVFFAEVHPASTAEVKRVLEKKRWLDSWLSGRALGQVHPRVYAWLATKGVHIRRGSPQEKQVQSQGIRVCQFLKMR